jgi:uncharacterized membrane protein
MVVEEISLSGGVVWIDKARTKGFCGVSDDVWAFRVGGYAIGQRFLRDRAGRRLSEGEIMRYRRALAAARETLKEMAAIDELIDEHGGLPIGFS